MKGSFLTLIAGLFFLLGCSSVPSSTSRIIKDAREYAKSQGSDLSKYDSGEAVFAKGDRYVGDAWYVIFQEKDHNSTGDTLGVRFDLKTGKKRMVYGR